MKNSIVVVVIAALIAAAGGFFAGMKYQQRKSPFPGNFREMRARNGQGLPNGQRPAGAQAVRGEIIAQDEKSLTVKLPDESSKIVLISENTEIGKTTEGSTEDLVTGEQVMVFGQENSDGSISATNIQIGTGFGGMRLERGAE